MTGMKYSQQRQYFVVVEIMKNIFTFFFSILYEHYAHFKFKVLFWQIKMESRYQSILMIFSLLFHNDHISLLMHL